VKSVSNERTFATDVRSPDEVEGALAALAAKVGQRLRRKGLSGRTVNVKLRFSDFTTKTVRRTLPIPSDDEAVFGPVARELLASAWSPGIGLRLLGVGISGFDERAAQLDLFAGEVTDPRQTTPQPTAKERARLVRGIDAVREKFGDGAVRYGRELKSPGSRSLDSGTTDEARSRPKGTDE
jgi:DNA polymerase IV